MPLISICIPAYKNADFLSRLLSSIAIQSFKDYEVIVTDDSLDNSLEPVINQYSNKFTLKYYKNKIALGTPANWNYAISKAEGEWIKMMHHDDWFASEESLETFEASVLNSENCDFIFSGYIEVGATGNRLYIISSVEKSLLKKSALNLFKKNFIGSPSTTLLRNNRQSWYDEKIKWVVDFEFYIRCLEQSKFFSIDQALINIGIHSDQVTKEAFRNPAIEISEALYLINKFGESILKNIFVYDYYWRLFRNLRIRNFEQIIYYSDNNKCPASIKKMLELQFKIPLSILNIRVFSKLLMLFSKIL